MWFIGLILGLGLGAAAASWEGAITGAVIGTLLGIVLRFAFRDNEEHATRLKAQQAHIDHIYGALGDIHQRLARLEGHAQVFAQPAATEERSEALTTDTEGVTPTVGAIALDATQPPHATHTEAIAASIAMPMDHAAKADTPVSVTEPPEESTAAPWWQWLMGGNTLVKVGIVILFFGVAFLIKFAAERDWIPIEVRLAGVAFAGIAMLIVGWRLRERRFNYALALQGGGIGVLYLVVYGALQLYHLIATGPAFLLLVVIAATSALLAVRQNAISLAILGILGGFLAPILASTGHGDHVLLFSYYTILNIGILLIAWFKAWRVLNLIGFFSTALIAVAWGIRSYRPELFATTEPFVVIFFVLYVSISVLNTLRQASGASSAIDATLVFGTPLVTFGLQSVMLRPYEYALAFCAVAMAAFYMLIASLLSRSRRVDRLLLVQAFIALGVVFATLAIPLALDGRWTSAAWALEGAGILWVGAWQNRISARIFGLLLQLAAGAAFFIGIDLPVTPTPLWNNFYLGCVLLSVAGFFSSWTLYRHRERFSNPERALAIFMFVWSVLWWYGGAAEELGRHVRDDYVIHAFIVFCTGSALLASSLGRALQWSYLRVLSLSLLPIMTIAALALLAREVHPFAHGGYIAWPLALGVSYWLLARHERQIAEDAASALHIGSLWLVSYLLAHEASWQVAQLTVHQGVWSSLPWALVPTAVLLVVVRAARAPTPVWPFRERTETYLLIGGMGLAVYLVGWSLWQNIASDGNPTPLSYVPLLNPADIVQAISLLALVGWYRRCREVDLIEPPIRGVIRWVFAGTLFVWLNAALLRTIHFWTNVPYTADALFDSMIVQASLSIFWTVLALSVMVFATRRARRGLWIVGAVLLSAVVIKLFLIELWNIGGVERIVSFIAVAVLLIVIGYFSPLPPSRKEIS